METLDIHKVTDTDTLLGIAILNSLLQERLISQKEYNYGVKKFIKLMKKPKSS